MQQYILDKDERENEAARMRSDKKKWLHTLRMLRQALQDFEQWQAVRARFAKDKS